MKKIVTATDLGGAPFFKDDMREIFNSEIWDVIEGLLSKFTTEAEGTVISGCVLSANSSNFDMTEGIVFLNGEFMRILAATNQTFPSYIAPATPSSDSRTFADGTTNALVETKTAELVSSSPGAGQFITIADLTSLNNPRVSIPTGNSRTIEVTYTFTGWDMDADETFNVAHGLGGNRQYIVGASATVFGNGILTPDLLQGLDAAYANRGRVSLSATNIVLSRQAASGFDDPAYNAATGRVRLILMIP